MCLISLPKGAYLSKALVVVINSKVVSKTSLRFYLSELYKALICVIVDEFASRPLLEARFLPIGKGIPLA